MTVAAYSTTLSLAAQHVIEQAHEAAVVYVDLQFTDITGLVKTVTIAARQLETALTQGIWFDGSAIEGFALIRQRSR